MQSQSPLIFFILFPEHYSEIVRKVVYTLVFLPSLNMKNRIFLGKKLGIPLSKLESIELQESRRSDPLQQRKAALGRMMTYWFENDSLASLEKLADVIKNQYNVEEVSSDKKKRCIEKIKKLITIATEREKANDESLKQTIRLAEKFTTCRYVCVTFKCADKGFNFCCP